MVNLRKPQKKVSLLHNIHGEPDQLLIIQWTAAILLSVVIVWNAVVDAYLGHEPRFNPETGAFIENIPTRYHPVGSDLVLFLIGIVGGSGSMYNWRRGQDRKAEVEKERIKVSGPFSQISDTVTDMETLRGK